MQCVFVLASMLVAPTLLPFSAQAAVGVPNVVSFQAKITNELRVTVDDGSYSMMFAIYTASTGGTCLWSAGNTDANTATIDCGGDTPDAAISVPVVDGVFSLLLGDSGQNVLPNNLFNSVSDRYIGIAISPDTAEMTPRIRLSATPWTMNADNLDGFDATQTGAASSVLVTESDADLALTGAVNIVNTSTNRTDVDAIVDIDSESADTNDRMIEILSDAGTNDQVEFYITAGGTLAADGNIIPLANDTFSLGTTGERWSDLYLGPATLHIGTSATDEGTLSYDTGTNVLNLATDSTTNGDIAVFTDDLYMDKSTGFVGVGDTTPTENLTVAGDYLVTGHGIMGNRFTGGDLGEVAGADRVLHVSENLTADATRVLSVSNQFSPGAAGYASTAGYFQSIAKTGLINAVDTLTGVQSVVSNQAVGGGPDPITSAMAVSAQVVNESSGDITSAYGVITRPLLTGAGDITDYYAVTINDTFASSTGVVGNFYGLAIDDLSASASVAAFPIRYFGPDDFVVDVNGWIGMGTTAPDTHIDIVDAENTNFIRLTDSTNADEVDIQTGTGTPSHSAESGSIYLDQTGKLWVNSSAGDAGTTWTDLAGSVSTPDFDEVYAQSITNTNLTMEIDDATGLTYNLTTTGDFTIADAGTPFVTFADSGFVGIGDATPAALFTVGSGDLFTVDSSGNVVTTKRVDTAAHAANVGLNIPTNAGAPSSVTGTAEGDIVWDATGDGLYMYNGASFVQIGAGGGGGWTDDGTLVRLTTATDNVTVGTATNLSANLAVDGNADEIQFLVQANAAQTTNLVVFENSAGTDLFTMTNAGVGTFNGNVTLGDATTDTVSFVSRVSSAIVPSADGTLDLGTSALRWGDLYLDGATLHVGDTATNEGTLSYNSVSSIFNFGTDATSDGDIAFFTDDLYLDKSAGRVGINDTTPDGTFDIDSFATTAFALGITASSLTTGSGIEMTTGTQIAGGEAIHIASGATTGSGIVLDATSMSSGTGININTSALTTGTALAITTGTQTSGGQAIQITSGATSGDIFDVSTTSSLNGTGRVFNVTSSHNGPGFTAGEFNIINNQSGSGAAGSKGYDFIWQNSASFNGGNEIVVDIRNIEDDSGGNSDTNIQSLLRLNNSDTTLTQDMTISQALEISNTGDNTDVFSHGIKIGEAMTGNGFANGITILDGVGYGINFSDNTSVTATDFTGTAEIRLRGDYDASSASVSRIDNATLGVINLSTQTLKLTSNTTDSANVLTFDHDLASMSGSLINYASSTGYFDSVGSAFNVTSRHDGTSFGFTANKFKTVNATSGGGSNNIWGYDFAWQQDSEFNGSQEKVFEIHVVEDTATNDDLAINTLLVLDNDDTTATQSVKATNAINILNSGGIADGITNGINIDLAGTNTATVGYKVTDGVLTGIDFSSGEVDMITDFKLQSGQTIDNEDDGTFRFTSNTAAANMFSLSRSSFGAGDIVNFTSGANNFSTGSVLDLTSRHNNGASGFSAYKFNITNVHGASGGTDIGIDIPWTQSTSTAGATERVLRVENQSTSSSSDLLVDTLVYINNADPTGDGANVVVTNGLFIDSTGTSGMTNGIKINGTSGTITNGLVLGDGAGNRMTTDITLQQGETIDNDGTDGTIAIGATILDVNGVIKTDFNGAATTNGVCHSGADSDTTATDRELVVCSGAPDDIAEWYETTGDETAGDLVVATDATITYEADEVEPLTGVLTGGKIVSDLTVLDKSSTPYESRIVGIVSTSPAQSYGRGVIDAATYPKAIATAGRVPLKVSDENGVIRPGDPITSSSTAGAGMKSTLPGMVVGIALDAWNGPGVGTIRVYVQPSWHSGMAIGNDGSMISLATAAVLSAEGTATEIATAVDSRAFVFRGSAWNTDTTSADGVSMSLSLATTSTTDYRLSVKDASDQEVALINNLGTAELNGDIVIGGKLYPSASGTKQMDKYIFYDNSEGPGGDMMRTNASGWSTGSYDFAEMFPSAASLVPGDVVAFSVAGNETIMKSTGSADEILAGIISTKPGFLAGENLPGHYPVALMGRVPTRVSNENGDIAIGDPLTASSTPGVAMKATESGMIVGYALEPYTSGAADDLIVVFVQTSLFTGESESIPGTETITGTTSGVSGLSQLDLYGSFYAHGNEILDVGRINGLAGVWAIDEEGNFVTKGLVKNVIESYQGEDVETVATVSMEPFATLVGEGLLENGSATIVFEEVNPAFNDIISTFAPIRVIATPNGPVSLYVSQRDNNGFTVQQIGGTENGVSFDWVVYAYRKDHEPEVIDEIADEGAGTTTDTTTNTAPDPVDGTDTSGDAGTDPSTDVGTGDQPADPPPTEVDVPASDPVPDEIVFGPVSE
ncbi:hypothetical protein HYV73_03345 [Candidatus Uhrbacteria bacterium]|nr:hypothetical protein [Candidatus Uhrbacteria bacterium]